jgi:hypothetical protein
MKAIALLAVGLAVLAGCSDAPDKPEVKQGAGAPPVAPAVAERVAEIWHKKPFARVLGVEHEKSIELPGEGDRRVYGDTVVTFYRSS